VTLKALAAHLKVKGKEEFRALRALVDELDRKGLLTFDSRGKMSYHAHKAPRKPHAAKPPSGRVQGRLSMTRRGFGFVSVEGEEEDIYIAPKNLHTALHGDVVEVVRFARGPRRSEEDRPEGEVLRVLERTVSTVTGRVDMSRAALFVVPDDERFARDIYVSRDDAGGAQPGDKVVLKLRDWTDEHLNPEGEIIEVLGRAGDARVEVLSVSRSFGLPTEFPPGAEKEAQAIAGAMSAEDLRGRTDCRQIACITIDPEDAKDFDDAVSLEKGPGGTLRLGVHIADVSHYVREGSALDSEAYARGTSVYMVNEVVPMLPERLSNDLCSLKPEVDRLTYSVFMDLDAEGTVVAHTIAESVIRSARRFTYEEAQQTIESGRGPHAELIGSLHALAQRLLKRRRKNGSLDFDTGEAKFRFDAEGLPSQIIKKIRLDAHRLVEECMLLANQTVARHVGAGKKQQEERPFLYRVHDLPDVARLRELASFVKQFGYSLDAKNGVSSRELQKLLDKVECSEVENVINEVALRSMAKAVYSPKNIGHYGLAFTHYTHFTSPIRRYPDLVVHRLLKAYAAGVSAERLSALRASLSLIARQSSDRERLAAEAERASVKVMQVEYMKRHIGDDFAGVITGVTTYGLFVEINDLLVEGFLPVRELSDDYYVFDERHYALRGRAHGRTYRLGDPLRVQVLRVNDEERKIDFTVA